MTELKGQAQRGARTREAIVDAAIDVFAVRGFRAGALAEIAAKVDLTPAGILYHFGSKEDLLVAVIAERDRRAGDVLGEPPVAAGLEALRGTVRIAELCEREPGLAALHTVLQAESFDPDTPAHDYFLARGRFVRSLIEGLLLAAREGGEVDPAVDCQAKANEFVAYLEGAAVAWLLDRELSLVDLYRNYIDDFIAVVSRHPG